MTAVVTLVFLVLVNQVNAQLKNETPLAELQAALKSSRTDSARADALLNLASHYILKPGEEKKDLDSARLMIGQAQILSDKQHFSKGICFSELLYSMAFGEAGNKEEGKKHMLRAIDLCRKYQIDSLMGYACLEERQYYDLSDSVNVNKVKSCYHNALEAFRRCGNKAQQGFCLTNLADVSSFLDEDVLVSLPLAREALAIYESINYPHMQGIYDLLGAIYADCRDHASAIKYGQLAIRTAEKMNDTSLQVSTIYNRIGRSYAGLREFEPSIPYFQKAMEIADKYHSADHAIIIARNYLAALLFLRKFTEATSMLETVLRKYPIDKRPVNERINLHASFVMNYVQMKLFDKAAYYVGLVMKDIGGKPENIFNYSGMPGFVSSMTALIPYYIATKQLDIADDLLTGTEKFVKPGQGPGQIAMHQLRYKIDSARGNFWTALVSYRAYDRMVDSVFRVDNTRLLAVTRIEYETEKKDKDIRLKEQSIAMLKSSNELQQQKIETSSMFQKMSLAGIVLLLLIFGLVYNQYRLKQKLNKEMLRKNQDLEKLVTEKEWLLKEVHHRVKNNLQTVMSLLEWQGAYLENDALKAFRNSQNRIYAMSLIHQKLYLTENVTVIEMNIYLPELLQHLRESFDTGSRIRFELDADKVSLDVSKAIPVGLIINEAVTNSIKYAFPDGRKGTIQVKLKQVSAEYTELSISDNGVGLPGDLAGRQYSSIGMRLMKGLTADMNGDISIGGSDGTSVIIRFPTDTAFRQVIYTSGEAVANG